MANKVWTVEEDCIDPYFEAHLVGIFSTEEKATAFVHEKGEEFPILGIDRFTVIERTVDEEING